VRVSPILCDYHTLLFQSITALCGGIDVWSQPSRHNRQSPEQMGMLLPERTTGLGGCRDWIC